MTNTNTKKNPNNEILSRRVQKEEKSRYIKNPYLTIQLFPWKISKSANYVENAFRK